MVILSLYEVFQLFDNIVNDYDYVIILLDDVELIKFNLDKLINYHEKYNLDISSPSITKNSVWAHNNMKNIGYKKSNKYYFYIRIILLFNEI